MTWWGWLLIGIAIGFSPFIAGMVYWLYFIAHFMDGS